MVIKILNVGVSKNPGGVETLVKSYYQNMDKEEFRFDFADIYADGIAFSDEYKKMGSKIHTLPNFKSNTITFIKEYKKLIRENHYDIIHIHLQSAANILVVLLSKLSKNTVVICHSHNTSTPDGTLRKILNYTNKFILRKMKLVQWACGQKAGQWMWGDSFDNKNIMYNAINYSNYQFSEEKRKSLRESLNISEDIVVLGFVGRYSYQKNVNFLIDILKKLKDNSNRKYKLLSVGGGDLKDDFLKKLNELGLKDNYIDLGIIGNTAEIYNAMDIFLLPSFYEGVPVVAVESQANGLESFLSSNISREISISSKTKFLDINNLDEWVEHIESISSGYRRDTDIDDMYKLDNAAGKLEEKYRVLVTNNR